MMPLFQDETLMRIYNYLAYRVKRGGFGEKNLKALSSNFDVAFPGYEAVIRDLERQTVFIRKGIEANIASKDYRLPVSGQAAAGTPLYSELTDNESVPVPQKYCSDRYMVIQAKGSSMEPQIPNGAHVVVEREALPANGELALVLVDGWTVDEYAIKLFFDRGDHVELRSYNPSFHPMDFQRSQILSAERIVHVIANG